MSAVRLLRDDQGQVVCIPASMGFAGIDEVEIERVGDTITLRPVRKDCLTFEDCPGKADPE